MGRKKIPDRWTVYEPFGKCVLGTPFLPFKTPLKENACRLHLTEEKWFTPNILMDKVPNLKAVVDLTDTQKYAYYNKEDFQRRGVIYVKINVPGRQLLSLPKLKSFFSFVDDFLTKNSSNPDALLGVHCTHGLNRTGYLICKYMVEKMKIDPRKAILDFEEARGHKIERHIYLRDIQNCHKNFTDVTESGSSNNSRDREVNTFSGNFKRPKIENWRTRNTSNKTNEIESNSGVKLYNSFESRRWGYSRDPEMNTFAGDFKRPNNKNGRIRETSNKTNEIDNKSGVQFYNSTQSRSWRRYSRDSETNTSFGDCKHPNTETWRTRDSPNKINNLPSRYVSPVSNYKREQSNYRFRSYTPYTSRYIGNE